MPGGVVLAANAALRAGAGKLAIATSRSVAALVAVAIPEARVMALSESRSGWIAPAAARSLDVDDGFGAVLVGPGMENENATRKFVEALLPKVAKATLVLDARALSVLVAAPNRAITRFTQPVILTPNAGEMAGLTGTSKETIEERPFDSARSVAEQWNAVVVLKGAATVVAVPGGRLWKHDKPNVGLAISGSGDTLAGIIAGLAARGASAEQAAAWAVVLHARAGESLVKRFGRLGYLARELPAEVPRLMSRLG